MYTAKIINKEREAGWGKEQIGVFQNDQQVGQFSRNYHSYGVATFAPFKINDNWFALYSSNYTCIRIMSLPDCKDIGGEEPSSGGFCPVEILVPRYFETQDLFKNNPDPNMDRHRYSRFYVKENERLETITKTNQEDYKEKYDNIALVAGCVWADDWSWKLQLRDISQADKGIIKNIKVGYLPLMGSLKDVEIRHDIGEDIGISFPALADIFIENKKIRVESYVMPPS